MNTYPTDYSSHDAEYLRRRALGNPGWEKADALAEQLDLLTRVFSRSDFPKAGKLLELGCGAGDWSLWAAERGYDVSGVDISPIAIRWAIEKSRQRGLTAHFVVGNVLELRQFGSDVFDVVLDGHCLHCIIGEDRLLLLREAHRVLRPRGIFHINTMCGNPSCEEYLRQFDAESRSLIHQGKACRYLGLPESIEQEVKEAGFTIVTRRILPRRSDKELDLLLLEATKP